MGITADTGTVSVAVNGHEWGKNGLSLSGGWHHIAVVFPSEETSSDKFKIYLDGVEQICSTLAGSPQTVNTGTSYAYMGKNELGTVFYSGFIDDLKIYDYGMASSEVSNLYNEYLLTDDFNITTLNGAWSWVRQDSNNWSLSARSGYMRIICQSGALAGATNDAKNILLRTPSRSDWSIVTKLDFNPSSNFQQAGLLIYQDDDNFVRLIRVYGDSNKIQLAKEISGTMTVSEISNSTSTNLYLKITKSGTTYTGYYSTNGSVWTQLQSMSGISLSNIKVGLMSCGGSTSNADFDWFSIQ